MAKGYLSSNTASPSLHTKVFCKRGNPLLEFFSQSDLPILYDASIFGYHPDHDIPITQHVSLCLIVKNQDTSDRHKPTRHFSSKQNSEEKKWVKFSRF